MLKNTALDHCYVFVFFTLFLIISKDTREEGSYIPSLCTFTLNTTL